MKYSWLAAPAILAASPQLAQSQQAPTPIPPVSVVATRTPEAPHDIPASIEVISGADLRARGVSTLKDALSLAAGISIAPGGDGGPASAVPEMWGLREQDAFLLVVDGIPWGGAFNPATASLSLRDVERIEILRGPAPVTFGATSFVGVIHVVHSAASLNSRYLSAFGGSYGSGGGALDVGLKMDKWVSRLSADFEKKGFKDDRTQFTRGHGLWRASMTEGAKKTWLSADLSILQQDPASPHVREGPALSTATPVDANYNPSGAYLNQNRFAISGGMERPVFDGATWGTSASYTYTANKVFRGFLVDVSNTANNSSGFRENIDVSDLYLDTHLIWPAKNDWRFMAGADLLWGDGEAKGATFNYTSTLNGINAPYKAEPTVLNLDAADSRLFLGAYASGEWKPDPRFTLSAGLRMNITNEKRGDGADAPSQSNTKLSYSVGALYSLWEQDANHLRAFVNYRDTFKPAAADFGLGDDEKILKPETSTSYEGGLKYRGMEGRWDVEASYFHMDFTNLVTATVLSGQPSLQNAGSTRFTGFELATDVKLMDATWARASYSSHDGKFVDFTQAFGSTNTQLAGKRFEMSAKQLYSGGITYAPADGFNANASLNYIGDRFLNKRNTAPAKGFSTYDAGVGFRMGRWEARLDGKNLGNARDAVSESEIGDAQYYLMPATHVQAGITIKW